MLAERGTSGQVWRADEGEVGQDAPRCTHAWAGEWLLGLKNWLECGHLSGSVGETSNS